MKRIKEFLSRFTAKPTTKGISTAPLSDLQLSEFQIDGTLVSTSQMITGIERNIGLVRINNEDSVYEFNKAGIIPSFGIDSLAPVNWSHAKARTMFVMVMVISESLLVLSFRRFNKNVYKSLKEDWKWLVIILVMSVPLLHILVMYITPLQNLLSNVFSFSLEYLPLNMIDWLILIVAIGFPILCLELFKWYMRKRKRYF